MKIVNDDLLAEFRCRPACEVCGRSTAAGADPHHLLARGMGGGNQMDVRENLIALCRTCHTAAHAGNIKRGNLVRLVAKREGLLPDELMDRLHELQRRTTPMSDQRQWNIHPVCYQFPIEDDDRDRLRAAILADGKINHAIILWVDDAGKVWVIDGRNRIELADELGITDIPTELFVGTAAEADAKAHACNRARRQLSPAQKAIIAAQESTLPSASTENHLEPQENTRAPAGALEKPTIEASAEKAGASKRSTQRAAKILKQCVPEVVEAVKSGLIRLGDAERLCGRDPEVQLAAMERVREGKSDSIKHAIVQVQPPDVADAAEVILDEDGKPVPDHLRAIFEEQRDICRRLEEAYGAMHSVVLEWLGHPYSIKYPGMDENVKKSLKSSRDAVLNKVPVLVCNRCDAKGCNRCYARGWLTFEDRRHASKARSGE